MPFWMQLVLFGIPGFLLYYGLYYGTPALIKKGIPLIYAFWFFLWMPVLILLPLSLILYWENGGILSWPSIQERFRLQPLHGYDWLWVLGAVVFTIVFDQLLEPVGKYFARYRMFSPPEFLPAPFNPLKKMSLPPVEFFGAPLKGNWLLLMIFVPIHLLAMISEELMWRGYILPFQETMFGNYAWIVNGLLWAWVVHALLKWHLVNMIPGMLIAPWVAQFTGSTYASFAAHAVGNSFLWLLLLYGILKAPSPSTSVSSRSL